MEPNNKPTSFSAEVGSGVGCLLFVIALVLFFNVGGVTTAIAHFIEKH